MLCKTFVGSNCLCVCSYHFSFLQHFDPEYFVVICRDLDVEDVQQRGQPELPVIVPALAFEPHVLDGDVAQNSPVETGMATTPLGWLSLFSSPLLFRLDRLALLCSWERRAVCLSHLHAEQTSRVRLLTKIAASSIGGRNLRSRNSRGLCWK